MVQSLFVRILGGTGAEGAGEPEYPENPEGPEGPEGPENPENPENPEGPENPGAEGRNRPYSLRAPQWGQRPLRWICIPHWPQMYLDLV